MADNPFPSSLDDDIAARLMDEVDRLRTTNAKMEEALEWYGEQARLARLIHAEGDAGRHALADDGGKRARTVLTTPSTGKG